MADVAAAIQQVFDEVSPHQRNILQLEARLEDMKKDKKKETELSNLKGFEKMAKFTGCEKDFGDWEFKLHQFIRPSSSLRRGSTGSRSWMPR